ncbi:16758_t:CDS:2, partial [Dentiscutata erythropus]
MHNGESSSNINNNVSMEWNQTNYSLPTEWSMNLTQDQATISLPNVYNNPLIEWSVGFSQNQTNNNLPIEWFTNFTNNNHSLEWNAGLPQSQTNTNLLNVHNNSIIE